LLGDRKITWTDCKIDTCKTRGELVEQFRHLHVSCWFHHHTLRLILFWDLISCFKTAVMTSMCHLEHFSRAASKVILKGGMATRSPLCCPRVLGTCLDDQLDTSLARGKEVKLPRAGNTLFTPCSPRVGHDLARWEGAILKSALHKSHLRLFVI